MPERAELPPRPGVLGRRAQVLLAILGGASLAWLALGLGAAELLPQDGGARLALRFFARALSPAWTYEGGAPAGAPAFLWLVAAATWRTLVFAAAGMSLALVLALPLSWLASSSWWGERRRKVRAGSVQWSTRLAIAVLRSVHELIWASFLLAALGLADATAALALALPYAGTLAKVFSEMLDEAPADSAEALRDLGAHPLWVFLVGRLPRALPDMASYAFYRFECAVRSSAVLGFFGYPTLGYYLKASFENLHYAEVWTWLYALCILVLLLESWSSSLRKRFVA